MQLLSDSEEYSIANQMLVLLLLHYQFNTGERYTALGFCRARRQLKGPLGSPMSCQMTLS